MIHFAVCTAAETPNAFQWAGQPHKIANSVDPHLIHGCLGPPESTLQSTSQSVQQFLYRAHKYDQQTDTLTDHTTPSVAMTRILCSACDVT